eukprot:CAMPEP_0202786908 /NCGR_PEP_ID=MMETSP1388-20130828/71099_1 /ASSEMBLY_ACC=CAM_ASM_000864 /TAXON_ID=37098 /ORGANISM="Isochrysis sp, Strain CCMP1244" /LENGTH=48 /DNA_ID= /DNA_START= /DNA_END= /DNA_ORIENTATION=
MRAGRSAEQVQPCSKPSATAPAMRRLLGRRVSRPAHVKVPDFDEATRE